MQCRETSLHVSEARREVSENYLGDSRDLVPSLWSPSRRFGRLRSTLPKTSAKCRETLVRGSRDRFGVSGDIVSGLQRLKPGHGRRRFESRKISAKRRETSLRHFETPAARRERSRYRRLSLSTATTSFTKSCGRRRVSRSAAPGPSHGFRHLRPPLPARRNHSGTIPPFLCRRCENLRLRGTTVGVEPATLQLQVCG